MVQLLLFPLLLHSLNNFFSAWLAICSGIRYAINTSTHSANETERERESLVAEQLYVEHTVAANQHQIKRSHWSSSYSCSLKAHSVFSVAMLYTEKYPDTVALPIRKPSVLAKLISQNHIAHFLILTEN